MKQETFEELEGFEDFKLEKAATKYSPENGRVQMAFVVGAKSHEAKEYWQKGMYSEEEVRLILRELLKSK